MKKRSISVILLFSFALILLALEGCTSRRVMIDWVNFIQLNDISYLQIQGNYPEENLAEEIDQIKNKVAGNVFDPNYKTQNGDSAFLEPGTPVYRLKNYKPTFRVGVRTPEGVALYESHQNPKAQIGADLLDLSNKVKMVSIHNDLDNSEISRIEDPQQIKLLVQSLEKAELTPSTGNRTEKRYFINFHLTDATVFNRAFWPDTNMVWPNLKVSKEFTQTILEAALKKVK